MSIKELLTKYFLQAEKQNFDRFFLRENFSIITEFLPHKYQEWKKEKKSTLVLKTNSN